MINILKIINIFLLIFVYFSLIINIIYYYQNDNYHLRIYKQYLLSIKKDKLIILLIPFIFFYQTMIYEFVLLISLIIILYFLTTKINKINYTNRMKRYLFINIVITLLFISIIFQIIDISIIKILILINMFYIIILLITSIISNLLEYLINIKYLKKAINKNKHFSPIIIGITGSCGKTSIKNYIYETMKNEIMIHKSKKSYNTLKGLSITINELLKAYDQTLILEMGLSHKGDIKKITKYFKPNIAIISEILPSHLQTMKSIDNIIQEKMMIVKNMKPNGVIIINNDNNYIKENIEKYNTNNNKIIKIGINNDNDYIANNIIVKKQGLEFDIIDNIKNTTIHIKNNLVGRHNVHNILITYAVLSLYNFNINTLNELNNYENRLEIKRINNMTILNDSYNSNPVGFMNALEVLSLYEGKKIIITPGIVEVGKEKNDINSKIATKITEICDYCYIIDNKNTSIFIKKFNEKDYKKYSIKKTFFEAFSEIKNDKITLLIENDLTDYFLLK